MLGRVSAAELPRCRASRTSAALIAVLALTCCSLLVPASAFAAGVEGGNAFNELSEKAQEQTTPTETTATTKNTETETRNSNKTILIAVAAAVVLLLGIGYVIVRDARRVAPAGPDEVAEGASGRDAAARRRNQRAKAKAARQQRKKNR
jgi:H+/Cl- antiporter ClcA